MKEKEIEIKLNRRKNIRTQHPYILLLSFSGIEKFFFQEPALKCKDEAASGARTRDLFLTKEALYP